MLNSIAGNLVKNDHYVELVEDNDHDCKEIKIDIQNELLNSDNNLPNTNDNLPNTNDNLPATDDEYPNTDDEYPNTDDETLHTNDDIPNNINSENTELITINTRDLYNSPDNVCRICFTSDVIPASNKLITPCKCSGSSQYIHMDCLQQWMDKSSNVESKIKCMECKYSYVFKNGQGEPKPKKCTYFCCNYEINSLSRSILFLIVVINVITGYIIYTCDVDSKLYNLESNIVTFNIYIIYWFYGSILSFGITLLYCILHILSNSYTCFDIGQNLSFNLCEIVCLITTITAIVCNMLFILIGLLPLIQFNIICYTNSIYRKPFLVRSIYSADNIVEYVAD